MNAILRLAAFAALCAFTILAAGESQACPKADSANDQDIAIAAIIHAHPSNVVASAVSSRPDIRIDVVDCCGKCSGIVCTSGSCPACASALPTIHATPIRYAHSGKFFLPQPSGSALAEPPPDYRPPRTIA